MSNKLNGDGLGCFQQRTTDARNLDNEYQWDYCGSGVAFNAWKDGQLWSTSKTLNGGYLFGYDATSIGRFDYEERHILGGSSAKKIIGTTLDQNGDPLGNCVVQGFLTSDDTYVGQTISDTAGYYELTTLYPGQAHYLVAYKSGSPDVAGTTVNTLIPV